MDRLKVSNYDVDNIIFSQGYKKGEGPFTCKGDCCCSGVYIGFDDKEKILKHKDIIIANMDETQDKNVENWFEKTIYDDNDFYTGKCTATNLNNNSCVFQNKEKLCILQVTSVKMGKHKWHLKPFYCILFPLVIVDKVLTFDDYQQGIHKCCTISSDFETPLFEACKEEIIYLFGEYNFELLKNYYEQNKNLLLSSAIDNK